MNVIVAVNHTQIEHLQSTWSCVSRDFDVEVWTHGIEDMHIGIVIFASQDHET